MEKEKISNVERVRRLEVGESDTWPIEKLPSIRSVIGTYGKALKRKFTTRTDDNSITVTRIL